MKLLRVITLCAVAYTAHAEDWPGWPYPGEILSQHDIPTDHATTYLIKIRSDDPRKNCVRITFDQKTRKVAAANWLTKENPPLKMPNLGIHIPEPSSPDARPVVILNAAKLRNVDSPSVALVNFTWEKRPETATGEIAFAEARRRVEDYVVKQGYTDAPTPLKPAELDGSTLERFPRSKWLSMRHGQISPHAVAYTHEVRGDAPGWTFGFLYQIPTGAPPSTVKYGQNRYFSVQIYRSGQNILVPHSPLFRTGFTPLREK